MTAKKLIRHECETFLCYVMEDEKKDLKFEDIPIVKEFFDVFLEEIPGLPPKRGIDFEIHYKPRIGWAC